MFINLMTMEFIVRCFFGLYYCVLSLYVFIASCLFDFNPEERGGSSIQERGFNSIPKQDVFYILWVGSANIVYIYILSRGEEF